MATTLRFGASRCFFGALVLVLGASSCSTNPVLSPSGVISSATDAAIELMQDAYILQDASVVQDSGSSLDASTNEVDAGAMCHSLVHVGSLVTLKVQPGVAPSPTGGSAADGVYFLSAINAYGNALPGSYKLQSTLEKRGNKVDVLESDERGDRRKSGEGIVIGTSMRINETCAFPTRRLQSEQAPFSATSTEIRLYGNVMGVVVEQIYTRK